MEYIKKKLDENNTRKLHGVLNKSWKQHPTKLQLYNHLPPILQTIQIKWTRLNWALQEKEKQTYKQCYSAREKERNWQEYYWTFNFHSDLYLICLWLNNFLFNKYIHTYIHTYMHIWTDRQTNGDKKKNYIKVVAKVIWILQVILDCQQCL